jgi:hypothetical protein
VIPTAASQPSAQRTSGRRLAVIGLAAAISGGAALFATPSLATAPPDSTAAEPEELEPLQALVGGLLTADLLGVPSDWAIRDIDSTVASDAELLADSDPFLGLLRCADGTIREGGDRAWVARGYSAPEVPLENGLLSIEIVIEDETQAQWESDRAAFEQCTVDEQTQLTVGATELDVDHVDTGDAATIELLAAPSATVPYPSAFNATIVNADDRTVTVVLGGVDMGESWQHLADDIAEIVVEDLATNRLTTTTSST